MMSLLLRLKRIKEIQKFSKYKMMPNLLKPLFQNSTDGRLEKREISSQRLHFAATFEYEDCSMVDQKQDILGKSKELLPKFLTSESPTRLRLKNSMNYVLPAQSMHQKWSTLSLMGESMTTAKE